MTPARNASPRSPGGAAGPGTKSSATSRATHHCCERARRAGAPRTARAIARARHGPRHRGRGRAGVARPGHRHGGGSRARGGDPAKGTTPMNPAAARVAPFYAVEINRIANARERQGLTVIHMEVGQPSAGAPASAIAAGHRALTDCPQGYWESAALAERLEQHYLEAYGLGIGHERIVLTMGASAALVLAMSVLFSRGDRVAVPRPG